MTIDVLEKWVDAGGCRTRYLEAGDKSATPLLLLHDGAWGGASSVTWGSVIPQLAERYWVIAPDLLGFGGTDKVVYLDRSSYDPRIMQLKRFLQVLGVGGPLHLVGNSYGGSLALRVLSEGPAFPLLSVVTVCGTGGPWRTDLSIAELGHWDGTQTDLRRILELLIDDNELFDAQLVERMRWAADVGHYRAIKAASSPIPAALVRPRSSDSWPGQLTGISTPVMLVAGERDVLLQDDWTSHLLTALPHARVEVLDCKHSPNIDRPEQLLTLLLDFFEQDTLAAGSRWNASESRF
jgi:pimeloyl-ACP methyl ester carboxylesterase